MAETAQQIHLRDLVLGKEAVQLCGFLTPAGAACLVSSAGWWADPADRETFWRQYFVAHWAFDYGIGRATAAQVEPPSAHTAWPTVWPLAVGFCGASSAIDHLLWPLPFMRCAFGLDKPQHDTPPPPRASWQLACHVQSMPHGAARLARCFICDVFEVASPRPNMQHYRPRWVRPCACSPLTAHRACLEKKLYRVSWRASRPQQLNCVACGQGLQISGRFPETFLELLCATFREWRWSLRRLFVMMFFYFWMCSLASHYCAWDAGSNVDIFLLLLTACLMSISFSQRFHHGVRMIWTTPYRFLYFQLFALLAVMCYMVSIRLLGPQILSSAEWYPPALGVAVKLLLSSRTASLVLGSIPFVYVTAASGLIFLFWKTSLRVPTIANTPLLDPRLIRSRHNMGEWDWHSECGLCQLGLCLDNPCM